MCQRISSGSCGIFLPDFLRLVLTKIDESDSHNASISIIDIGFVLLTAISCYLSAIPTGTAHTPFVYLLYSTMDRFSFTI